MKQTVWVFDIDGVITDPITKTISQPRILEILVEKLRCGGKIAFNTGRSAEWLETNVISPLKKLIISKYESYSLLSNLISICEMGNVILQYNSEGNVRKRVLNRNVIPKNLSMALKEIVETVYSESMFIDDTKEVILTIEMKDGYSQEQFKNRQAEFQKEINIIMKHYHPDLHVKPSSTTIAIDVKPIDSDKELGAAKILKLHCDQDMDLENVKYLCFGDSASDLEMSDYFSKKLIETEFVFVGDDKLDHRVYPIQITKSKYSDGTLEYLQTL